MMDAVETTTSDTSPLDQPEDQDQNQGQDQDQDQLTLAERILPDSALARWAIYLAIAAVVAAILWFWVFPPLQHLLPEGF